MSGDFVLRKFYPQEMLFTEWRWEAIGMKVVVVPSYVIFAAIQGKKVTLIFEIWN